MATEKMKIKRPKMMGLKKAPKPILLTGKDKKTKKAPVLADMFSKSKKPPKIK